MLSCDCAGPAVALGLMLLLAPPVLLLPAEGLPGSPDTLRTVLVGSLLTPSSELLGLASGFIAVAPISTTLRCHPGRQAGRSVGLLFRCFQYCVQPQKQQQMPRRKVM